MEQFFFTAKCSERTNGGRKKTYYFCTMCGEKYYDDCGFFIQYRLRRRSGIGRIGMCKDCRKNVGEKILEIIDIGFREGERKRKIKEEE